MTLWREVTSVTVTMNDDIELHDVGIKSYLGKPELNVNQTCEMVVS